MHPDIIFLDIVQLFEPSNSIPLVLFDIAFPLIVLLLDSVSIIAFWLSFRMLFEIILLFELSTLIPIPFAPSMINPLIVIHFH